MTSVIITMRCLNHTYTDIEKQQQHISFLQLFLWKVKSCNIFCTYLPSLHTHIYVCMYACITMLPHTYNITTKAHSSSWSTCKICGMQTKKPTTTNCWLLLPLMLLGSIVVSTTAMHICMHACATRCPCRCDCGRCVKSREQRLNGSPVWVLVYPSRQVHGVAIVIIVVVACAFRHTSFTRSLACRVANNQPPLIHMYVWMLVLIIVGVI